MDESRVDPAHSSRVNRLVLIDGNAILHRAYHALPPLTAPDGTVVNAVYGFTSMLMRLYTDLAPTHMAVAFDRPKPTFRKELFEGYQAKRPKMDDDLVTQIPLVHDVVEAFHVPIFEMDGFEADDVIGTLAKRAFDEHMIEKKEQHMIEKSGVDHALSSRVDQVIIVTGDRDILQLVVDEKVLVYMPTKGLSEAKLYGEKEVVARLGVAPKYVADLKALAGDSSDNYPGVAGIGPKTAVSLIMEFGSVEKVYKAVSSRSSAVRKKFSNKIVEKLQAGAKDAVLFKEVASIRTDVPLDVTLEACRVTTLNTEDAKNELMKFGFQSLVKRLAGGQQKETKGLRDEGTKKKKAGEPAFAKAPAGKQQELF